MTFPFPMPPPVGGSAAATVATLTIATGTVASDLTNFLVRINLADMPSGFWSAVKADGGNIRVYQSDGVTQVPFDLTFFQRASRAGELFAKLNVATASNTVFKIAWTNPSDNLLPATDTYGRNAAWSDYDAVFIGSLTNRTGSGIDATLAGSGSDFESLTYSVAATGSTTSGHSGVTTDGTYFYITDTNALYKYDADWSLVASVSNVITAAGLSGLGLNHCGDLCIHGGELFIPIETYPSGPYANQHIAVFDPATLSFTRSYDISANAHECSSICWDATNGYFVITDYTNATTLHKYDASFTHLGTITMASLGNKQGIEYFDGNFYVTADVANHTIYRLSLDGATLKAFNFGGSSTGMEGLCSGGNGDLFVFVTGSPSDAVLTVRPDFSRYGWLAVNGGNALATGLPKRTSWTMGTSLYPNSVSASNKTLLSYGTNNTTDANRATLSERGSANLFYAIWNSTDGFQNSSGAIPAIGTAVRMHHTQNGTTDRKIYQNGALVGTDTGTAQRPASTGDTLFIGAEDTSYSERMNGVLGHSYLRNGVLTADWLAAEYASWRQSGFYTVS